VLRAAGIPVDDEASNGGFVPAPNDCMAFDFAECWNTKKSLFFNLPPGNYSVKEDGEWEGRRLVPLVALAGDALLEPFWPMGLGLKRGWQAIMDTCYVVDNLYNPRHFCEKLGKSVEEWAWEDHFQALSAQAAQNFEYCTRTLVAKDLAAGEWDDKGMVMTQLQKKIKDAEKPPLEVEIDPWTRYEPLAAQVAQQHRELSKDGKWLHPAVGKAIAMKECNGSGEIQYKGKDLISYNGMAIGGCKQQARNDLAGAGPGAAPVKRKAIGVCAAAVSRRAASAAAPTATPAELPPDVTAPGDAAAAGSIAAATMGGEAAPKALRSAAPDIASDVVPDVALPRKASVAGSVAAAMMAGVAARKLRSAAADEPKLVSEVAPVLDARKMVPCIEKVAAVEPEICVEEAEGNVEKSRRLLAVRENIARLAKELLAARVEEKALLAEQ